MVKLIGAAFVCVVASAIAVAALFAALFAIGWLAHNA